MNVNTFLYYLKKLPLIGSKIPESMYGDFRRKKHLQAVVSILHLLKSVFSKVLYLGILILFPAMLALKKGGANSLPVLMVHVLFCLSVLTGALTDSMIFTVTRPKIVCLKYLKMDPALFVRSSLFSAYFPHFAVYLPILCALFLLSGGTLYQALGIWLLMICFRFSGEALQLAVFEKTGVILSRKNGFEFPMMIVFIITAYLPLFKNRYPLVSEAVLTPYFLAAAAVIGVLCFYYINWGYRGYQEKLPKTLDTKFLFSEAVKQSKTAAFSDVAMKEEDLTDSVCHEKLRGFPYLNTLFFERHRRQLMKPARFRALLAICLFPAGAVLYFTQKQTAVTLAEHLTSLLPSLVIVMYFLSVADKACRAMFYNCDLSLLRFPFYRRQNNILNNFRFRLFKVCGYNLIPAAALCTAAILFRILCRVPVLTADMGIFIATILLLGIFFGVHHIFMYYVFQPYTTELNVRSPFFSIINTIVYMLCFMCMRIQTAGISFALTVLLSTGLYVVCALAVVWKVADRTFRIK